MTSTIPPDKRRQLIGVTAVPAPKFRAPALGFGNSITGTSRGLKVEPLELPKQKCVICGRDFPKDGRSFFTAQVGRRRSSGHVRMCERCTVELQMLVTRSKDAQESVKAMLALGDDDGDEEK